MSNTKDKGIEGELAVMFDLAKRGYIVSIPYGNNAPYDILIDTGKRLLKAQVKYSSPDEDGIKIVNKTSHGSWQRRYTDEDIDILIGYDPKTGKIYYIPSSMVNGKAGIFLRYTETKNGQVEGIKFAKDFEEFVY